MPWHSMQSPGDWGHKPTGSRLDFECGTLAAATAADVPDLQDDAVTGWRCSRSALVSSTCWCEKAVVVISVGDMLDRQTKSCGRVACRETP